ncbi:MAG: DUF917 domain-containing protein [Spirochaetales bacterium]|nr:DUF917 domain-containing protein [Spirochaetales bacterium]
MKEITAESVLSLYYGSLFTACGGGEYSEHLPTIVERHLTEHGPVKLISLQEAPEDGQYISVGVMGSRLEASLQTGKEGLEVLRRLREKLDSHFEALFSIELSSLNVLFPILVAALAEMPIVDGDCMGRAFPEFQMTTAQAMNEKVVPMSILTAGGNYYHFENIENLIFEAKAREIVSHEEGIAYFAGFPLRGEKLRRILLPGTMSFVGAVGDCFIAPDSYSNLTEALTDVTKNSMYGRSIELFIGTVENIEVSREGGRTWSRITVKGSGDYRKSTFLILAQNECLLAYRDNSISAMVPDLITLIDLQNLKPLSLSALHRNIMIAVHGVPAPVRLKSSDMLQVLGPACFGYNEEYLPLEGIHYSRFFPEDG